MDESSGARVDVVSSAALTPAGVGLSSAGFFGLAGKFDGVVASSNQMTNPSTAFYFGNQAFSLAAWAKLNSKATNQAAAARWVTGGNNRSYMLNYLTASDAFFFNISADGIAVQQVSSSTVLASPSTGTWYLVVGTFDNVSSAIGVSVNGSAQVTAAVTGFPSTAVTSSFSVGALSATAQPVDGKVDEVAIWNRVLTNAEVSALYNAGVGRRLAAELHPRNLTASRRMVGMSIDARDVGLHLIGRRTSLTIPERV